MDKLTALRVFQSIVREGSFVAAARRVGLSPAAVSKNIAELEAELGLRLFNRTTRRLSLTEAGEVYADRTERILENLEEADRMLLHMAGEVSGRLRVAAPVTLGLLILSPIVPTFLRQHPGLTLDLHLDERRVDIIGEGFDVALRGGPAVEDSRLIARRIGTLNYTICATPDYLERKGWPRRPEEMAAHDFVQFSLPDALQPWTCERGSERIVVPVSARYAVNSSLAVRDALRDGLGLGRIPELYVRKDLKEGRLVEVLPEWSIGSFDLFALYPSRRHVAPKVSAFVTLLQSAVQSVIAQQESEDLQ
jgi:DNA-binding transcriptional LysR family regulator